MNHVRTRLGLAIIAIAFLVSHAVAGTAKKWQPAQGKLMTPWAADVTPDNVHKEYPRPQMVRKEWLNLNGLWDLAIANRSLAQPTIFPQQILVPFAVESALSGVMKMVSENERIWYKRTFKVPAKWLGQRLLLHFGAVDFETVVWVNGKEVGQHRGGYDPFWFDITEAIRWDADNEIVVGVWDPTDAGTQPRGKQIRNPHGIWYTPTSGIWQTVWLEPVNSAFIRSLEITPDIDKNEVTVSGDTTAALSSYRLEVTVRDGWRKIGESVVAPSRAAVIPVSKPKLWTPETPHLYDLVVRLKLGDAVIDEVRSYFGMRKISLGKDQRGFTRILLNNQSYFQLGLLDQGFWPDGLYTAPTEDALKYDIEITKKLGFNMARKHVKVEPARWYYWCDKLGLLVWQDMPSGEKYIRADEPDIQRTPESGEQFENELLAMITSLRNHPSIVMWVPYNEGWGQWDTARITSMVKTKDPSRLVNNASGWTDRQVGDVNDIHKYPGPGAPEPEQSRAGVLGEFGGLGLPVRGHTWQDERNWGYRSFTNKETLTTAYVDLLYKTYPLIATKGLSAAVYTQTTDVEVEVNGLITYDRRLLKMDVDKVRAANFGKFAPRPVVTEVVPTALSGRPEWRYTTTAPAPDWEKPGFNLEGWKNGTAGFGRRGTPGSVVRTEWNTDGIWMRREFTLPNATGGTYKLFLHHDEDVDVYLNGVLATRQTGHIGDYTEFDISRDAMATLRPGTNTLAVHCRQTSGGQYVDVGIVRIDPPPRRSN